MKRYLSKLALFVGAPIIVLSAIYFITDPFYVMKPFSLEYFNIEINRDYPSVELYMMNKDKYNYNSYIIGSCGLRSINSYHWRSFLDEEDQPYMFMSWGESLTGIENKIDWLYQNGKPIKNVLIMIDIPSSFREDQLPTMAVAMHDYKMSGVSKMKWHLDMYFNFLQKPSFWLESIGKWYTVDIQRHKPRVGFDIISNDIQSNATVDISKMPDQEKMKNATPNAMRNLNQAIILKNGAPQSVSEPLINQYFENKFKHIKSIFDECGTSYRIFLPPKNYYTSPRANEKDIEILKSIFGEKFVFDFSGDNEITRDLNYFKDTEHFGASAGWLMVEEMYGGRSINRY